MFDYSADVIIAGAGLATAYDLLDRGKTVLVLDNDSPDAVGGLARLDFGGICMAGTPRQRRTGIEDSPVCWMPLGNWSRPDRHLL